MSSDFLSLLVLALGALYVVNAREQRQRIALLGQALKPYQIERLIQTLIQGYLRAMGEPVAERRTQVLATLADSEAQLRTQLEQLASDFQRTPAARARVSRLAISLPWVTALAPALCFDMRRLLALHANGIARAMANAQQRSERDRAYTVTAELLLLQHSCHWFCKSRAVASARVAAHHHTPYRQIVAAITPETRSSYLALIHGSA